MQNKKGLYWTLTFIAVFLLTQDYLFTTWTAGTGLLGLPPWLFWFMVIHVLFIVLFYFFSKRFWNS